MDQIEGGTLIVNPRKSDGSVNEDEEERNLNVIHGLAEAWKRAEVRSGYSEIDRTA
jgi:hypothetical protein